MLKTLPILQFTAIALLLVVSTARCMAQQTVQFWNGNKTDARQHYELKMLDAALSASETAYGDYKINTDNTELTSEEESAVFRNTETDVFVTVAGNPKLKSEEKIIVTQPLMKGLIGYRLLIVREQDLDKFAAIQSVDAFKQLSIGIPQGWADADLFRHNGYDVVEGGTFDEIFDRLANKEFDYVALGANEIEKAFENRAETYDLFAIEPSTLVYYPFTLVFYVDPSKPELAERLRDGLQAIKQNGKAEQLFQEATGDLVERLGLTQRKTFYLNNPMLPAELKGYRSPLLSQPAN